MKEPSVGDTVIDRTLILRQRGVITNGVFSFYGDVEIIEDCLVRFSPSIRQWYSAERLRHHWVDSEKAYILT